VRCPEPAYPRAAVARGWQGTVDVELRIDPTGAVTNAEIAESSGFPLLDSAALTVARQSRFHIDGTGNGTRGRITYSFRLTGGT
jgi:protein TonB